MKRKLIIHWIGLAALLLSLILLSKPAAAQDKFKIHLASGWSLSCVKYWYEGDQILLTTTSGITLGFNKQEVAKIENLEVPAAMPAEPSSAQPLPAGSSPPSPVKPATTPAPAKALMPGAPALPVPPTTPEKPASTPDSEKPALPVTVSPEPADPETPETVITSPTQRPAPPRVSVPVPAAPPTTPPTAAKPPIEEPEIVFEDEDDEEIIEMPQ